MKLELQSAGLHLARGQMLKVLGGAGCTVCALEGSVWITEEKQPDDIVLESGHCYRLERGGLAIVQSLGGDAAVSLGQDGKHACADRRNSVAPDRAH